MGAPRRPWLVSLAFRAVRVAAWIVPHRDRCAWRREWEGELAHGHLALEDRSPTWRDQMTLLRRALGSLVDAAWLRRQFTRDNEWTHDLRHAWRQMRGRPRLFGAAALMLAVGIGATAAGWSMLDRLVLRALPYDRAHELVTIWQNNHATGNDREEVSPGNFLDWKSTATSFAAMAAAEPYSVDLQSGERPVVVPATKISEEFFPALGVRAFRGRLFEPADFVAGAPRVTVISHAFWTQLGADEASVGRPLRFDGLPHIVVGILPQGVELNLFDERGERDVWLPKVFQPHERDIRGEGWWMVIARLRPAVSRELAQTEMDGIARRFAQEHPRTNAQTTVALAPLESVLMRQVRPALRLLLAASVLVLVIACANVANLLLVRAAERDVEFAVRSALGASRGRLVRQVLLEAGLLSAVATVMGIAVSWLTLRAVVILSPISARALDRLSLDASMVGMAVAVGMLATFAFGLIPAWMSAARGSISVAAGSRWATGGRRARLVRQALVTAEIAVAVILATGAGLLTRSFMLAATVDPGFDVDRVGVVQVFAYDRYNTADKLRAFHADVVDGLRRLPGVTDVGSASAMPLISANINIESPFIIDGRPPARRGEEPTGYLTSASPGYFTAMGIRLLKGRLITDADSPLALPVVMVSRTLADRYWPSGDPLGAWISFRFLGQTQRRQVVGVVDELRHDALELPPRDEIFLPFAQAPFGSVTFVYKTAADPASVLDSARAVIWDLDPEQTIYDDGTAGSLLAQSLAPRRFTLLLAAVFATVALILAAAGVYSTISYTIGQQQREFGVRIALGASAGHLGTVVLRHGLWPCVAGISVGLAAALGGNQLIRAQLFGVTPFDPVTLAGVIVSVLTLSSVACLGPARKAMRTDPVSSLR